MKTFFQQTLACIIVGIMAIIGISGIEPSSILSSKVVEEKIPSEMTKMVRFKLHGYDDILRGRDADELRKRAVRKAMESYLAERQNAYGQLVSYILIHHAGELVDISDQTFDRARGREWRRQGYRYQIYLQEALFNVELIDHIASYSNDFFGNNSAVIINPNKTYYRETDLLYKHASKKLLQSLIDYRNNMLSLKNTEVMPDCGKYEENDSNAYRAFLECVKGNLGVNIAFVINDISVLRHDNLKNNKVRDKVEITIDVFNTNTLSFLESVSDTASGISTNRDDAIRQAVSSIISSNQLQLIEQVTGQCYSYAKLGRECIIQIEPHAYKRDYGLLKVLRDSFDNNKQVEITDYRDDNEEGIIKMKCKTYLSTHYKLTKYIEHILPPAFEGCRLKTEGSKIILRR